MLSSKREDFALSMLAAYSPGSTFTILHLGEPQGSSPFQILVVAQIDNEIKTLLFNTSPATLAAEDGSLVYDSVELLGTSPVV